MNKDEVAASPPTTAMDKRDTQFQQPELVDPQGTSLTGATTQARDSRTFLAFHYGELKDLGKHFLTVVSAVLAFSVTFSEKMIDFTKATVEQKSLLIGAWSCMIVAVVAAGTGLYYNYVAGAQASGAIIKGQSYDFKPLVRSTYRLYQIAGGCFISGLVALATMAALRFL